MGIKIEIELQPSGSTTLVQLAGQLFQVGPQAGKVGGGEQGLAPEKRFHFRPAGHLVETQQPIIGLWIHMGDAVGETGRFRKAPSLVGCGKNPQFTAYLLRYTLYRRLNIVIWLWLSSCAL